MTEIRFIKIREIKSQGPTEWEIREVPKWDTLESFVEGYFDFNMNHSYYLHRYEWEEVALEDLPENWVKSNIQFLEKRVAEDLQVIGFYKNILEKR